MPNSLRMASRSSLVNRYRPAPIPPTLAKRPGHPQMIPRLWIRWVHSTASLGCGRTLLQEPQEVLGSEGIHSVLARPRLGHRNPRVVLSALTCLLPWQLSGYHVALARHGPGQRAEDPRFARAGLSGRS